MDIDADKNRTESIDVAYVAHLARLELTTDEIETFQDQLEHVVGYVRKLQTLDLDDIEPTSHARPVTNVFRPDEVRPSLEREIVLENAPARTMDQFSVPRILE